MNPFDLRGPAFLGFFILSSVTGLVVLYLVTRAVLLGPQRAAAATARRHLRDPYLVAYLRGGAPETLRTLVFALHQRKLLTSAGEFVMTAGGRDAFGSATHPLERTLLVRCSARRTVRQLIADASLTATIEDYAEPLRDAGLMADDAEYDRRRPTFLFVFCALAALAGIKILVAVSRGHSNIVFLIFLAAIALFSARGLYRSPRTNAGRRALYDQQTLFSRLKTRVNRLATDGATNEAVLVAATFGLDVLPQESYPFAAQLRRQSNNDSSNSSSGCGSSCSSGGSGCGGGGGCGGCGS